MASRRAVAQLQLADIDREKRTMIVRGKGAHERVLPIVGEVWSTMETYLVERGTFAGHLLQAYQQSYANVHDGLTAKYVARLAGGVFRRAGIKASGHALRHAFAQSMIDAGANIRDVQVALGHASISTTQVYLGYTVLGDLRGYMEGSR